MIACTYKRLLFSGLLGETQILSVMERIMVSKLL